MGFQKNEYFLGILNLWILFRGHHNIGLYLGVISIHFRAFFRSRYRIWNIFLVAKISIFGGCLKFLIYFWGELKMLGSNLRIKKK